MEELGGGFGVECCELRDGRLRDRSGDREGEEEQREGPENHVGGPVKDASCQTLVQGIKIPRYLTTLCNSSSSLQVPSFVAFSWLHCQKERCSDSEFHVHFGSIEWNVSI